MAKVKIGSKVDEFKPREAFTILPAGPYALDIESVEVNDEDDDKQPFLIVRFKVAGVCSDDRKGLIGMGTSMILGIPGEEPGDDASENEKTAWRISFGAIASLWKAVDPDAKGQTLDTDKLDGKRVVGQIQVNTYVSNKTGKERTNNRCNTYLPASEWEKAVAAWAQRPNKNGPGSDANVNRWERSAGPVVTPPSNPLPDDMDVDI